MGMHQLLGPISGGSSDYQIDRSLRFNQGDSPSLSKSFSSNGNRKKWTFSCWFKLGLFSQPGRFFSAGSSATERTNVYYHSSNSGDGIAFYSYVGSVVAQGNTTIKLRDPSAWYHLVFQFDCANSTNSDRVKIYINGVEHPVTFHVHPSNIDHYIGGNVAHYVGRGADGYSFDGYLAECHYVNGQLLSPSNFGELNDDKVWIPKEFSGSYGTNGFYLKFADNSSASALGTDSSGGSNTFTVSNLSVAAGTGNDSLLDTPTNGNSSDDTGAGGELSGNYCVINSLGRSANNPTLSDGNLKMVLGAAQGTRHGTMGVTSGKWYFEVVYTAASPLDGMVGVANKNHENNLGNYLGGDADGWGYYYNGEKYNNGGQGSYGASWGVNDVMGIALDMDNGALYFSKNGTYQNSGDPTSGSSKTGAAFTNLSGTIFPCMNGYGGTQVVNFGQRAFNTNAPSGYKCWNTANLPDPAIADGSDYFDTKLYTGNGSTQSISGYDFSPDFVWIKTRSQANDHVLVDSVRGVGVRLFSNDAIAENTQATSVTSFNSDGFSLGSHSSVNQNAITHVAWCWDGGSSTVSNTDGSITSYVRVNQSAGFSIVSYTGNSTNGATVGHGLNAKPTFIILKARNAGENWFVNFPIGTGDGYLMLNQQNGGDGSNSTVWNSTAPTSSVFTLGTSNGVNGGLNYIAYCFAPVEGYSSFGSYTGNGSSDGPFVSTGMRPKWVMIKHASGSGNNWMIFDTTRNTSNVMGKQLYPNLNAGEADATQSGHARIDFVSNGFKLRGSHTSFNTNGESMVYAAFAEHPFKTARAR